MPGGDGTGPMGWGSISGRGGAGFRCRDDISRGFARRGRVDCIPNKTGRRSYTIANDTDTIMMGGRGLGPGGNCVCPDCGYKEPHQQGLPCVQKRCPQCGQMMTRE